MPTTHTPLTLARQRGIERLVHYTTNKGLYGTIAASAILSRAQLEDEDYLEHIRNPVWPRRDPDWIDHISLSVTWVNTDLFRQSRRHFPELWWAVICVDPTVLNDDGVYFTTTNNIYPAVRRGRGVAGFEAIFAEPVAGRYGVLRSRRNLADNQPTDGAAEVLYPQRIRTEKIEAIYVGDAAHRRTVLAWCEALDHGDLAVEIRPDAFL